MFIIEVIVGGGGVLGCIILNSVPNILSTPLTYMRGGKILGILDMCVKTEGGV